MNNNELLRMSFVIGENSNSNLRNNLRRLIYSILYKNGNQELSEYSLSTTLENEFDLSFSIEEIKDALNDDKNIDKVDIKGEVKYKLIPRKYSKLEENEKTLSLENVVDKFCYNSENHYEKEYVYDLLTKYLYEVFNKNKSAILSLLNNHYDENTFTERMLFSDEEKQIINQFLNWENVEKDTTVFNAVSYCVDYCMLTTKKDGKSFRDLFSGKKFYLDANVILRLIGFNNEERQQVLQVFIKKCKEVGIKFLYTNFTLSEIENTINANVRNLKEYNGDNIPLSSRQYKHFIPRNQDLIKLYTDWYVKNRTHYNDYNEFTRYLRGKVNSVLVECNKEIFSNQEMTNKTEYTELYLSLKNYKENLKIVTNEKSLSVDINNFQSIKKIRDSEKGSNMYNLNTYLITTDSKLCDWNKQLYPGEIPLCILPSTWYSLILKICGRSNNDFRAFNMFLNLRYKNNDENLKSREEILKIVQRLPEPKYIKEKVLDKIYSKLTDLENDYEPQKIVDEEVINVAEEELLTIWAKDGNPFIEKGERQALDKLAEKKATKKYNHLKAIPKNVDYGLIFIGIVLAICISILVIRKDFISLFKSFFKLLKNEEYSLDVGQWITIVLFVVGIVSSLIVQPIKRRIDSLDLDEMIKKEQNKILNEYNK